MLMKERFYDGKVFHAICVFVLLIVFVIAFIEHNYSDVRLSEKEEKEEKEVYNYSELDAPDEEIVIDLDAYDDALVADSGDDYTEEEREADTKAWNEYLASCGENECSPKPDPSTTCNPEPVPPIEKPYPKDKVKQGDIEKELKNLIKDAANARLDIESSFKCILEDYCDKDKTKVTYKTSFTPSENIPNACELSGHMGKTITSSNTFSANGKDQADCIKQLHKKVSDWAVDKIKENSGLFSDPCPDCSFYTKYEHTPVSADSSEKSCSTSASVTITCGKTKKNAVYDIALLVTYDFKCKEPKKKN